MNSKQLKIKKLLLLISVSVSLLPWSAPASSAATEKMTVLPAKDFGASVSGNERYMAFVSDRSGNYDLWIKDLLANRFAPPARITNHPAPDLSPSLNRDGTKILYVSKKSDPRGDIYLLDRISHANTKLTDMKTGDSSPKWSSDDKSFYYIGYDYAKKERHLIKFSIETEKSERLLTGSIHSFTVQKEGNIIYSDGRKIISFNEKNPSKKRTLTDGLSVDILPSAGKNGTVFFVRVPEHRDNTLRYARKDTPSIWAVTSPSGQKKKRAIFRLTDDGHPSTEPYASGSFLYFSDLRTGNILRADSRIFFGSYRNYKTAMALADSYRTAGEETRALMVMGNISRNSIGIRDQKSWEEFNFDFIRALTAGKRYDRALSILKSLEGLSASGRKIRELFRLEVNGLTKLARQSVSERRRTAKRAAEEILRTGKDAELFVYGTSLLEAGKLLAAVDEDAKSIALLNRAAESGIKEIEARALFSRAMIYRKTGNLASLTGIFVDIIRKFGPESFWGKKAVSDTVSLTEKGETLKERLLSLRELSGKYPDIPSLNAASLFRQSALLRNAGEELSATERLDRIIKNYSGPGAWVEKALTRKADILSKRGDYNAAFKTYGILLEKTDANSPKREVFKRGRLRQRVKEAYREREAGEVKIAAKSFRMIIDNHPESVEGHRGYIESKVMLGEYAKLEKKYRRWVSDHTGGNGVPEYALGLTLTYADPPKLKESIRFLEEALRQDQSVTYFHQTLGWAYEQFEKQGKKRGYFEKANAEYLAALELNDALELPDIEADLLLNTGNTWFSLGNFFEALRFYRERDSIPVPFRSPVTAMLFRKHLAETCFKTGDSECAITQYRKASALLADDKKNLPIKAELYERTALAFQDLGKYSEAVRFFSQALEVNHKLGQNRNITLLLRNIGVNLYNLSLKTGKNERSSLVRALESYLRSLVLVNKFGVNEEKRGKGLINIETGLGENSSTHARGFDRESEKKLLFGYIADTYERLSEPEEAVKYYMKKVSGYPDGLSPEKNAALLTEKGVTLNRLGVIYYKTGRLDNAEESFLSSLEICLSLGISHGTAVNILNLSRVLSLKLQKGERVPPERLLSLFNTARLQFSGANASGGDFHIFSSLALLARSAYDPSVEISANKLKGAAGIRQVLMNYTFLSDAIYYAKRTLSEIERDEKLPQGIKNNLLMFAKINLDMLLMGNSPPDTATRVTVKTAPDIWVRTLFRAENAPEKEREKLLKQAADTLLATPPLLWNRGDIERFLPLLKSLETSLTGLLIGEKRYIEALSTLERLEERITALMLLKEAGEDIFFTGVDKELADDIKGILEKADKSRKSSDIEKTEELLFMYQESVFALYDENPSAVSLLYHYDLPVSTLSEAIGPNGAYLRGMKTGETATLLLFSKNGVKPILSGNLSSEISGLSPVYISGPDAVVKKVKEELADTPTVRVNSFYNILDARNNRTLFLERGVATADFTLDRGLLGEDFPAVPYTVKKGSKAELERIKISNFLAGVTPLKDGAFQTETKNGLHDRLPLPEIAPKNAHTAFLMNLPDSERKALPVRVESLIRTGYSHVVVNESLYDRETASKLISLYLSYSQDLPAAEALSAAMDDISEWSGRKPDLTLYGYFGMEEEERVSLASAIYKRELQDAAARFRDGDFKNALESFENALWTAEASGKDEGLKKILELLVESSFKSGDYTRAVRYQKKLLPLISPENEEERAKGTYTLGILYSRVEQYDKAVAMISEAVRFWKRNEELDELAKGVSTLGVIRENMGKYPEAFSSFLASSELLKEIGESSGFAGMLRKMGRINYLRLGRYEEARKNFLKAGEIYKRDGNKKGVAETAFETGFTFEKTGLFDRADTFYREGIAVSGENELDRLAARGKLYLANTSWFRGEYQKAFQYISEAANRAESSDKALNIMIENTKGLIYWTLNEPGKAVTHIKKALKAARREKMRPEIATSLNNLGLVYRQTGDLDKSIKTFKKALGIDRGLKSKWGEGYDYRNLGISLMLSGKYADAEKLLLQAEKTSGEINNRTNRIKSLLALGNLNLMTGKTKRASGFFESAYKASTRYHIKEVSWRAAYGKGRLEAGRENTEKALYWYKTAVTIVESMRAGLRIEELRNSFQANKTGLYRDIITLLVKAGKSDSAFNYLERSRSRSFIDLLGNKKIEVKSAKEQIELDNLNRLFLEVETVSRETGAYETPPPALLSKLERAQNSYEEALIELKRKNPELSSFVSVDPLEIGEFRKILDKGVTAISYMVTDDEVLIWLISRKKTLFFRKLTKHLETENLVKRYRKLLQDLKPVDKELKRLYEILIKPAENEFDKNSPLLIIPDGPLHYLSFSALKKDGEYLVDRTPVFYSPSASVLKFTFAKRREISSGDVKVLAIGNPDLGSYNYDLPMAEFEAESIKWNYPGVDVLTRGKATKKWIVSNIGNYNIIHIASHGEFNSRTPLLSALVFASEKGDTGRLTVQEIFSLDLKADIITLSACQTGLGKLKGGELIGLNRSFIYAGTHSLISSLWRVDDLSTALLMKHFYRNFTRLDTGASLRKAQLIVKKHFPHPAYWAGFSLVGDYKKGK